MEQNVTNDIDRPLTCLGEKQDGYEALIRSQAKDQTHHLNKPDSLKRSKY